MVPRISAAVAASITWGIGSFPFWMSPPFSWGKFCFWMSLKSS